MPQTILLTGAAGRIGTFFLQTYADRYKFVLTDQRTPEHTHGFPFTQVELSNFAALRPLFDGVDTVVHLGADPSPSAPWESLLPSNVVGLYNVFEAAHQAGCRRVVFASSINAVNGYADGVQVHTDMPINTINLYGATKCWGEAVASCYANAHGLSGICLRFGAVQPRTSKMIVPGNDWLDAILTYDDCARLIAAAVDAPESVSYGVFHGVSNNRYKRLDISDARTILGYAPQDDAFVLAEKRKG